MVSRVSGVDRPAWIIELGRPEAVRLSAYGVLLAFLGIGVFSAVAEADTSGARSLGLIAAFVVTVVVHELVHGLFFWLFGGSHRYGMGISYVLPYLYTTSDGDRFDTRQMTIIGLAPLVLVSVVMLIGARLWPATVPYLLVGFVANFSGAVGDLWLVAAVRRFRRLEAVSFEDRRTGVAVWTDDPNVKHVVERMSRKSTTFQRFATHFLVATLTILVLTLVVGVVSNIGLPDDQAFRIGPAAFPLLEKTPLAEGILVSISFGPPIIGGLLFGALSAWLSSRHTVTGSDDT